MKSNVNDYLEVVQRIYIDSCTKCVADVSDLRDLLTIRSRVEKEGLSFLTISLPNFCRDFERSLSIGFIDSTMFLGFEKIGSIPAFLQGMISLIFDRETGRVYDEGRDNQLRLASDVPTLIKCVRQICLSLKKLEIPCTHKRVQASLASFTEIEHSFEMFIVSREDDAAFRDVSSVLWGNFMGALRVDKLIPRHGPGTTGESLSGNRKYSWLVWHNRLEPYFPVLDFTYGIGAVDSPEFDLVAIVAENDEQPVKVTPVPKTLKGPRIIAIEPCCMQYSQQALRGSLCDALENFELTAGHINFRDQSVNQRLAMSSSIDGQFVTIDLSDASDRVPLSLVKEMFHSNPDFWGAIESCRSTRAELPDGTVIGPLSKFASMGSALCFPVEAMYFYTICVMALLECHDLPVSHANVFNVSRGVYVYGDDIIVPTTYATVVLDYLRKYNCKVNTAKTFLSGSFRESCGMDAYKGVEVTPTYLRTQTPENKQQARNLISWTATGNQFLRKGYWKTAHFFFSKVEEFLGRLPMVSEMSPGLGRVHKGICSAERWSKKFHRFEVKAWIPRPVYRTDVLDGYGALTKCLLYLEGLSQELRDVDEHHLKRSAQFGAVTLIRRWVSAS